MEVQQNVQQKRQYLEKHDLSKFSFNIWAFIFNTFYFLWQNMIVISLGIFLIQALTYKLCLYFDFNDTITLLLVLLPTHIFSGLFANKFLYRYMQRYIELNREADTTAMVNFVRVPLWRICLNCLLSLGFYIFYWSYIQWKAIRRDTKYYWLSPFWRSVFLGIFLWVLIYRTYKNSPKPTDRKYKDVLLYFFSVALLLGDFYVCVFDNSDALFTIQSIIGRISLTIGLMLIQHKINCQNTTTYSSKQFLIGEILMIAFGWALLMPASNISEEQAPSEASAPSVSAEQAPSEAFALNAQEEQALYEALDMSYIYMVELESQCAAHNYEISLIPQAFASKYAEELDQLNNFLKTKLGTSLSQVWASYSWHTQKEVSRKAQVILQGFRETLQRDPNPVMREKANNMTTVCEIFDNLMSMTMTEDNNRGVFPDLIRQAGIK